MKKSFKPFAALAFVVGLTCLAHPVLANGKAASALHAWINAAVSGDLGKISAVLAPEFQIVRGSGLRYDASTYLADGLPTISSSKPTVTDIMTTNAEGLIVVSYWLEIEVAEGDKKLTRRAPRLTVFREVDGQWLVSSHANFAVPAK